MTKINILLPLYNDWRSCNFLMRKINKELKKRSRYANIIILNDFSTQKIDINNKNLKNISKIKVLTSKKNLGSQKIISLGLEYIKNKRNEIIVVMDSDGEDDVLQLNFLIDNALEKKDLVIVASRIRRRENIIFKIFYKAHLLITYFFTFNWISFGNYSSFHTKNVRKILKNNDSWLAYSSCIIKNCKILKIDTERKKRFYDKSKLSFFGLFKHSIRVLSVFQKIIFYNSLIYISFLFVFKKIGIISSYSLLFLIFIILLFNFLILFIKKITFKDFIVKKNTFIKKIINIK